MTPAQTRVRQEMFANCHQSLIDAIQTGRVEQSINWCHQLVHYARLLNPDRAREVMS